MLHLSRNTPGGSHGRAIGPSDNGDGLAPKEAHG